MGAKNNLAGDLTRRRFLAASAASAGLLWQPIRKLTPGELGSGSAPPGFPEGINLYRRVYENWALEIRVDDVWSAEVTTADDVVNITNWAAAQDWRVRPSGAQHGWVPLTVMPDQPRRARVVIVDTRNLDGVRVDKTTKTVFAQAGATLDNIMASLSSDGLGFSSIPAPGVITIAGALAISGHGAAIPARGEDTRGRSFGSLSNRIVSLEAVVFDPSTRRYQIKTFDRSNPMTNAMLTNLGRVFLTSVVMKAEDECNLRCVSYTDITTSELFAPPGSTGRTFASFVEQTGRAEAILFPFTDRPWFKTWEVTPTKPAASREVNSGYNYSFSDNIPLPIARLTKQIVAGQGARAKEFGPMSLAASEVGLRTTNSYDLWGPAYCTQHYIKASTIRATASGHAILTSRANIQRVLHEFITKFNSLVAEYESRGLYPVNMPLELRCGAVDDPRDVGVPGAKPPTLSAMAPYPGHPEWDTVVFLNSLHLVGSDAEFSFKRDLERWILSNYRAPYACARVEWTKGWAYTDHAGWSDGEVLDHVIPAGLPGWDAAVAHFNTLDPKGVFTNEFLERLIR